MEREEQDIANNGWQEYRRLVLKELERLNKVCEDLTVAVNDLRTGQAVSNVKLAIIAFASSLLAASAASVLVEFMAKH